MSPIATKYQHLIEAFLCDEMDAREFEALYLEAFKNETAPLSEELFVILNTLFGAVDNFVLEPSIKEQGDLDITQLRVACEQAINQLKHSCASTEQRT